MRRNPQVEIDDEVIDIEEKEFDPKEFAPWYDQLLRLDEKKRQKLAKDALLLIKESRPDTYEFIKQYRCPLVGMCPAIEYVLLDSSEGELDMPYVHAFSRPTLLYWHPKGKFAFVVNVVLECNDTVLNKVRGNSKESIRGFTG